MNSQHSDILVHWTSKELAGQSLSDPNVQSSYVDLLFSIYSKGLLFSQPKDPEVVVGVNVKTELPSLPIICFTELRLSQVQEHADRYGRLGIGFRREFLMTWGANPVFYMQNKNQGIVNTNLASLANNKFKGLDVFLSYIKQMGEPNSNQYPFYDESEWRMVACKLGDQWPERFVEKDGDIWFRFKPEEVLLLAVPDEAIRLKCLADHRLGGKFLKKHMPMMVDTSSCNMF
jgi:hypothetical protein